MIWRLFANEVVLEPGFGAREGHVRQGQKQTDAGCVAVIEFARVYDQIARLRTFATKVKLVGRDVGASRRGGLEERDKLWHGPFTRAEFGKGAARHAGGIDLKGLTKRRARRDNLEVAAEKQQRLAGAGDDGERARRLDVGPRQRTHELGLAGRSFPKSGRHFGAIVAQRFQALVERPCGLTI